MRIASILYWMILVTVLRSSGIGGNWYVSSPDQGMRNASRREEVSMPALEQYRAHLVLTLNAKRFNVGCPQCLQTPMKTDWSRIHSCILVGSLLRWSAKELSLDAMWIA